MSQYRHGKWSPNVYRTSTFRLKATASANYDCRLCQQNHPLRKCSKFNKMDVSERRQVVRCHRYCENCLAHSHQLSDCQVKTCCRHCGAKHHTLLHCPERIKTPQHSSVPTASYGTVIPTIMPMVKLNTSWQPIRGLLNPCVEYSTIAHFLIKKHHMSVEKIGEDIWCTISVRSRFEEGPIFKVTAKVTKQLPTLLGRKRLDEKLADYFTNLRLADPNFYLNGELNLILGADVYPQLIKTGIQPQCFGMAMAQDTMLGWTIIGRIGA